MIYALVTQLLNDVIIAGFPLNEFRAGLAKGCQKRSQSESLEEVHGLFQVCHICEKRLVSYNMSQYGLFNY